MEKSAVLYSTLLDATELVRFPFSNRAVAFLPAVKPAASISSGANRDILMWMRGPYDHPEPLLQGGAVVSCWPRMPSAPSQVSKAQI